jgi:hypothetical protein
VIFEHQRFEIWNLGQHPYKHSLAEFSFTNPALPGVTNVQGALNWMLAVLYPNAKAAVADPASLPLLGNTINDSRVVLDDGDGKAASYRWEQREGDVAPKWYKVMDMDWSTDSILAGYLDVTQELYVVRRGRQDTDDLGAVIAGTFAGQTIYGGTQANQNLTLRANSGDGVGPSTGYVQVDDNFRPAVNGVYFLGTSTERFLEGYFTQAIEVGNLLIEDGTISHSSGQISFDNENLVTTGYFSASEARLSDKVTVRGGSPDELIISGDGTNPTFSATSNQFTFNGQLRPTTGLYTTALVEAGLLQITDPFWSQGGILYAEADFQGNSYSRIFSSHGILAFGGNLLTDIGNMNVSNIITCAILKSSQTIIANDNTALTLTISNDGVNPTIISTYTGETSFGSDTISAGYLSASTGITAGNIDITGNQILSTNLNGDINITTNGTGKILTSADIIPANGSDIGNASFKLDKLFIDGQINNGTDNIAISTLLSLRSGIWRDLGQTIPAQDGDTLFWDAVNSVWLANHPDTEIFHDEISNLTTGDAGHTQFVMLAGRAGGQTVYGGTLASQNLNLDSTSSATKGVITFNSRLEPLSTAAFSGSWSGIDVGSSSKYFNDLYMRGEAKNLRLENFTFATLPSFSAQNIGRIMYATDTQKAYIDIGTAIKVLGVSKFISDTAWNGSDTTKDIVVSADIQDARNAMWALHDNANDFDRIYCSIKAISATTVRVTVSPALPAGSYRLIGIE